MRSSIIIVACALCAVIITLPACDDTSTASPTPEIVIRGKNFCNQNHRDVRIRITPKVTATGAMPNAIHHGPSKDWYVVESGTNHISRMHDDAYHSFADLGRDRNPYEFALVEGNLWVANYLSNTVSIVDGTTGAIVDEIRGAELKQPSAVAYLAPFVLVGNVNFHGGTQMPYGPGSVTIIDARSHKIVKSVATDKLNPQIFQVVRVNGKKQLMIVNSGAILFNPEGAYAGSPASVEFWEVAADASVTKKVLQLPLVKGKSSVGAPGSIAYVDNGAIFLASATAPVLFELAISEGVGAGEPRWIHGSDSPIVIDNAVEKGSNSLNHVGVATVDGERLVVVTSFNTDSIYLVDPACGKVVGGPYDVGTSKLLEGPHAVDFEGNIGYVIMALSNVIAKIEITAK